VFFISFRSGIKLFQSNMVLLKAKDMLKRLPINFFSGKVKILGSICRQSGIQKPLCRINLAQIVMEEQSSA
jgi:hypothetical protein